MPAVFFVPPIPAQIAPKVKTRIPSHLKLFVSKEFWNKWKSFYLGGERIFIIKLLGASKREYATRNTIRATVY